MPSLMVDFTISPDGFPAADGRPASDRGELQRRAWDSNPR
jgi:hypothetical protein